MNEIFILYLHIHKGEHFTFKILFSFIVSLFSYFLLWIPSDLLICLDLTFRVTHSSDLKINIKLVYFSYVIFDLSTQNHHCLTLNHWSTEIERH